MPEHKNGKKNIKVYFFSFMRLCSKSSSCNRIPTTVISITAVIFLKTSYYRNYTWSKNIKLTVN